MPVYNGENYIRPCLESILNQTFCDFELIIVDDGSKDNSANIIKEYMEKDSRIRYFYQENQTACVALNNGLMNAQGTYVTFADNDDLIELDTYQKVATSLQIMPTDIVVYGYSQDFVDEGYSTVNRISNNDAVTFEQMQTSIISIFENGLFHPFWNKWYRREMIVQSGITFDKRFNSMGDYAFNCKLFPFARSIKTLDFIGYHYLKRNRDSLVASFVKDMVPCFLERRKVTKELFSKFNLWGNSEAEAYYTMQFYFESEDFLINLYKKKCDISKEKRLYYIQEYILDDISLSRYKMMKVDTLYSKIFKFAVDSHNPAQIGFIYQTLTRLKDNFFGFYKKFRKMQYKKYK
ncbi:MAG: glycosyltransferase family 2 protein [Anaerorhabdus sp.]